MSTTNNLCQQAVVMGNALSATMIQAAQQSKASYLALLSGVEEITNAMAGLDFQAAATICDVLNDQVTPPQNILKRFKEQSEFYQACDALCRPTNPEDDLSFKPEYFTPLSKALLVAEAGSEKEQKLVDGIGTLLVGCGGDDPSHWADLECCPMSLRAQTHAFYNKCENHLRKQALQWYLGEVNKTLTEAEAQTQDKGNALWGGSRFLAEPLAKIVNSGVMFGAKSEAPNVIDTWKRVVRFWHAGQSEMEQPDYSSKTHLYSQRRKPLGVCAMTLLEELEAPIKSKTPSGTKCGLDVNNND